MHLPPEVGLLTLVLAIATILAWFGLELLYVLNGLPSISEQIWRLYSQWPPIGMLSGLVVGLLLGHFFFGR